MKKILALLLAMVMLLSFAGCAKENKKIEADPERTDVIDKKDGQGEKEITVIVVHKDGSSKQFLYDTDEEFLGALLADDGLIEGNAGPYGMEITKVDGEKAVYTEDNAYWGLYENGEYALQGIDTTPIKDGGEYKLEYTPA